MAKVQHVCCKKKVYKSKRLKLNMLQEDAHNSKHLNQRLLNKIAVILTREVKVTTIVYRIYKTQFASFFVYRKHSRDRFRILN